MTANVYLVAGAGRSPSGKFVWSNGAATIAFGKRKGTPLARLVADEPDYLAWILSSEFSSEVKGLVRKALNGEYPQAPDAATPG